MAFFKHCCSLDVAGEAFFVTETLTDLCKLLLDQLLTGLLVLLSPVPYVVAV
jgi:hypothetical protein